MKKGADVEVACSNIKDINLDENLKHLISFPYLEKGSNYLIKEFPDEKTYQDSKEKINEL